MKFGLTAIALFSLFFVIDSNAVDGAESDAETKVLTNSLGMKLKLIPPGEFMMGSPLEEKGRDEDRDDDDELPQHPVTISKPYYLGIYEVTQAEWEKVMGTTPWKGKKNTKEGADLAATYISWNDAVEFCKKLSAMDKQTYRLPTEAEWERGCRGGTKTAYSFGNDPSKLGDYAFYLKNGKAAGMQHAQPIGQKRPNPYGLYDMHGNVWEWCSDWYAKDYYAKAPAVDPKGPDAGEKRVCRGSSWSIPGRYLRSANRFRLTPDYNSYGTGLRVVLVPEEKP